MSIINFSPHSQYLYSPISFLHIIKLRYKLLFISVYLLIIPFYPKFVLFLIFIISYIFSIFFKYIQLKSQFKNKIIKIILLYLITFIVLIFSYRSTFINNYQCLKIYYPYIFKYNMFLKIAWKFYYIPWIIIKSFSLIYNTFFVLNILFFTTKLEEIMIFFLYIIHSSKKINDLFHILCMFSFSLSTQFLYHISNQLMNNFISFKIRKIENKNVKYIIYLYCFISFIDGVIDNIKNITYILYSRELRNFHFYLVSI